MTKRTLYNFDVFIEYRNLNYHNSIVICFKKYRYNEKLDAFLSQMIYKMNNLISIYDIQHMYTQIFLNFHISRVINFFCVLSFYIHLFFYVLLSIIDRT